MEAAADEYAAFLQTPVIHVQLWRGGLVLVDMRWVLTCKLRAGSTVERRKSLIVAKGCTKQYGMDYFAVWAPTDSLVAYRAVLALAAARDWDIDLLDQVRLQWRP